MICVDENDRTMITRNDPARARSGPPQPDRRRRGLLARMSPSSDQASGRAARAAVSAVECRKEYMFRERVQSL